MICYKCDKCLSIHESLGEMNNLEISYAGTASVVFPRNGKFHICDKCKKEFLETLHAFSRVNNVDKAEDTTNAANIEENEVYIPVRSTLNPDSIESGSLNFETKMYEECPVVIEGTHDQDYSIRFFDNTEVKKSWIMHMTKEQFKGTAIGMAHMLGLEITGDKENDQV